MSTRDRTDAPDGAGILDALHAAITRYVSLPNGESVDAVTLWTAATHAQPAWAHAPRLVIRAPERRCGKSRLLDMVEATCHAAADHGQRLPGRRLSGDRHQQPTDPADR